MKQLPESVRPRERLLREGEGVMSQAELLAILLGSGTPGKTVLRLAEELLLRFGDLATLSDATVNELIEIPGVGLAKAVQLRAVFALANRYLDHGEPDKRPIRNASDAYHLLRPELEGRKEERIAVLLQDAKGVAIGVEVVAMGTLTKTLAHPREIFYPAIRHKAAGLTIAHNHPSGDPTPSAADLTLTRRLIGVGQILDMPVHDHLIIGRGKFVSLREFWQTKGASPW